MFQSTRPRGARLVVGFTIKSTQASFNPRARVGRDVSEQELAIVNNWFQSTRPRGARRSFKRFYSSFLVFQSTRPRGARPSITICYASVASFQSTRPRGARLNQDLI